jgi:hypothetical protein
MNNQTPHTGKTAPLGLWSAGHLLAQAFTEQKLCMASVYETAAQIVRPPAGSPPEYAVRTGTVRTRSSPPGRICSRPSSIRPIWPWTFPAPPAALRQAEPPLPNLGHLRRQPVGQRG